MQSLERGTPPERGTIPRSDDSSVGAGLRPRADEPGCAAVEAGAGPESVVEARSGTVELAVDEVGDSLLEVCLELVRLRLRQPSVGDGFVDPRLRFLDE